MSRRKKFVQDCSIPEENAMHQQHEHAVDGTCANPNMPVQPNLVFTCLYKNWNMAIDETGTGTREFWKIPGGRDANSPTIPI
jgi:hypothetical protein